MAKSLTREALDQRVTAARLLLSPCRVCPRNCGVDRLADEKGVCGAGRDLVISSYGPHFGEEDVLVGSRGSGTIFFTGCNLRCVFCQNHEISRQGEGRPTSIDRFADIMLELETRGCHNINFVSPTHFTPQIIEGIAIARTRGLSVPLVYNCGGYESVDTLKLLDGIIDVYMPDAKYADAEVGARLSDVKDYPIILKQALKEMHRQVGDLDIRDGVAVNGLLIRHLVLPNNLAGTEDLMRFIAEEISPDSYVNVMAQYRPAFRAASAPEVNRRPTPKEYAEALLAARKLLRRVI